MTLVQYASSGAVAVLTMDDGKANALSPAMQASIGDGLDRAVADGAGAVVLAGRPGRFSAGFDLRVMQAGGQDALDMVQGGFELAEKLLSFPRPVVAACTGHAMAMGSFLLLSVDHRVGADGEFKIQANEVAIGMTMPYAALAITRHRLTPPAFDRAMGLAALWSPREAASAGWLDEVVPPEEVVARATEVAAAAAAGLDPSAHAATKLRARGPLLGELRRLIESGQAL